MTIFVGDDWAEAHHDIHVMNQSGDELASRRLSEGLDGIGRLHELIAQHANDPADVVVGIETDRGLWVDAYSDEITVTFTPEGYPQTIDIDPSRNTIDEELRIDVLDLITSP